VSGKPDRLSSGSVSSPPECRNPPLSGVIDRHVRQRDLDYERLELETFSDLRTAAKIYRAHGFELTSEEVAPRWGRDPLTYQHYALVLAPAQSEPATQRVAGSA